jgi:hypothetical protein
MDQDTRASMASMGFQQTIPVGLSRDEGGQSAQGGIWSRVGSVCAEDSVPFIPTLVLENDTQCNELADAR